eukprot:TRINITY_DN92674_c0_g1_i1.p1 TRINITY_DN92674_c0_g1~~TRINITY_DN92674_c0_g1_i1.p1  ORF type:complete len:352 (+),score=65.83 TRINITY_DN92674_c0_g1_i1:35-1090(+)
MMEASPISCLDNAKTSTCNADSRFSLERPRPARRRAVLMAALAVGGIKSASREGFTAFHSSSGASGGKSHPASSCLRSRVVARDSAPHWRDAQSSKAGEASLTSLGRRLAAGLLTTGAWAAWQVPSRALVKGSKPPKEYGMMKNLPQKPKDCSTIEDCEEVGLKRENELFGSPQDISYKTTPAGVRYKDMVEGNVSDGVAKEGSILQLKYRVMRAGKRSNDGLSGEASTIFSIGYGEDDGPKDGKLVAPIGQGKFVKSLEEGLLGMAVGGKRRIQVRPENGLGWRKIGRCAEKIEAAGIMAGIPGAGAEDNTACLTELLPQPKDSDAQRRFNRRFDESLIVEAELVGLGSD